MAAESENLRHLSAIILAELAIEKATKHAFKEFLPAVLEAVLHGKAPVVALVGDNPEDDDNGGILLINPANAELTRAIWAALAISILFEIGKVIDSQMAKYAPGTDTSAARQAYLASVGERLLALPDEIFVRVQKIVDDGVREGLTNGQLARRIRDVLSPLRREYVDRARKVGRTEGIAVYNGGIHQAYLTLARQSGQNYSKTWVSLKDERVRHTHVVANGQKVALAAKFTVGGFAADYPGDPRLPAAEACNCRCVARYAATMSGDNVTNPIVASIDEAYATDGRLPNGWRGPMAPLGRPTGDGRQLNVPESGVRTRELPITFDWAPSREGGHDGAVMAGRIDNVWVEGDMLWGEGAIDVGGYNGAEYARQLADGFAMFVSVDPDEVTFETQFFNAEGEHAPFNEAVMVGDGQETLKEGYTILDVMTDWRLAGVTAVTIPAFMEARIEPVYDYVKKCGPGQHKMPDGTCMDDADMPTYGEMLYTLDAYDGDDEGDLAEMARAMKRRRAYDALADYDSEGDSLVATVTGSLSFPVFPERKRKWDGHAARQNVAKWASSDGSGDPDKINKKKFQSAFLWMGEPNSGNSLDGEGFAEKKAATWNVEDAKGGYIDVIQGKPYIVANAVIGLAGGHGIQAMSVPAPAKKAMLGKLKTLYGKMSKSFPDFPAFPFSESTGPEAELVAASGQVFDIASFENPGLDGPTPLNVKDGRVYGHVALFDSCYMAQGGARTCIKPPKGGDYSRFLTHGARLADGEVLPVGMITFGEGHFAGGSLRASMANYANLATGAAKVNCGEDEWGVWVAGEVIAAFADRADDLLLSPLSGHWEPDLDRGGALTLIAAHVVVTPGFHVPRLVASLGSDGELDMAVVTGPFTFLERSTELFDEAVEDGQIEVVGEREDGVALYDDVTLEQSAAMVAAVRADRKAQRAMAKLGVDPDSRATLALSRMGVRQ